ncbi:sugar phosphate isomerase/epimerase [Nonomuraea sp. NBC_00507]|uniref:TIM barrel protein n=1 Tax=Nonomuraea sp. NBC_00507 TaxID=2976002 RepID=UPI002E193BF2
MTLSRVRLGTAPDSWGVWFPDDPNQVPWDRFLDEVAAAGYQWIELGPYGYLPTDPEQLCDELGLRGLRLSGGAVFSGLHRGREALKQAIEECRAEARLLTALGATYLVSLPEGYTDLDGNLTQPVDLTPEQWKDLTTGMSELARVLHEECGVELVFHPHADSHVDTQERVLRFLEDTDPEVVSLCLDTGHISYCGGDNIAIIRAFPERIGYVHLKQVDPEIVRQVREENLCFAEAVRRGAMIEPPGGIPAMEPLLAELGKLDADLFAIVEQDLYPCPPDTPLPIATRTRTYLNGCGLRP